MSEISKSSKKAIPLYPSLAIFILTIILSPTLDKDGISFSSLFALSLSGGGAAWIFFNLGYFPGITAAVSSFFLNWYLCDSPIYAIIALSVIPCGLVYSFVSKRRLSRSRAVGISVAVISLLIFGIVFLSVFAETNTFSLDALKTTYQTFFNAIRKALTESFTIEVAGNTVPFITAENAEQYINMIIGLMPGIVSVVVSIICYTAGWVYKALLALTHINKPESSEWKLLPAPLTAAFFCISVLISNVSGSNTIVWLASSNIALILCSGFFFEGVSSLKEINIVNGLPRPRIFRTFVMALSLFGGIPVFAVTASVFGVIDSIKTILPGRNKDSNDNI